MSIDPGSFSPSEPISRGVQYVCKYRRVTQMRNWGSSCQCAQIMLFAEVLGPSGELAVDCAHCGEGLQSFDSGFVEWKGRGRLHESAFLDLSSPMVLSQWR